MELQTAKQRISLLILSFTAASVIGWLCEEICIYLFYGYFYNRGMLHLTLCPIYGFGACGIWLLLRHVQSMPRFFLFSMALASVFEYACSYLLEWLFHRRYWTYADWVFSFQDRVSLLSSIGFALLALAFVRLIVPYLRRRIRSGNDTVFFAGSLCIAALIFGDFLLSAAA